MFILNSLTKKTAFLLLGTLAASSIFISFANAEIAVSSVGCPNIPVKSLERSVPFFKTVLDFKQVDQKDRSDVFRFAPGMPDKTKARSAHMTLGDECVDLTEYDFPKSLPFPTDSHGNDRWFQHIAIVVSDMDKAYARLREAHVQFVSNVPQTLPVSNKSAAGISAFYFRDPDGHYLELIHFPSGKGQAKWQSHSDNLFLGIDHTAITVSDTARSLAFYRDKLHLRVVGGSENYGIEQEHLSGVFNAHVLITSLRSDAGIGVEFLEYISPTSGRNIQKNLRVNDIPIWHLPMEVHAPSSEKDDKDIHWKRISPNANGALETAWVKDPDGHMIELLRRQ